MMSLVDKNYVEHAKLANLLKNNYPTEQAEPSVSLEEMKAAIEAYHARLHSKVVSWGDDDSIREIYAKLPGEPAQPEAAVEVGLGRTRDYEGNVLEVCDTTMTPRFPRTECGCPTYPTEHEGLLAALVDTHHPAVTPEPQQDGASLEEERHAGN